MRNLANVDTWVSNLLVRVELGRTSIAAFQVIPKRERAVSTTHIGILKYKDGQLAVFTRESDHWVAHLLKPAGRWTLEKDSLEGHIVTEPVGCNAANGSAESYRISTQHGLQMFAVLLRQWHGECEEGPVEAGGFPTGDLQVWLESSDQAANMLSQFDWFDYTLATYVSKAPNTQEVGRMEITALQALSQMIAGKDLETSLELLKEAAGIADTIVWQGKEGRPIRLSLRRALKDAVRLYQQAFDRYWLDGSFNDEDRYTITANLEWLQTQLVELERTLGHYDEVETLTKKLEWSRIELLTILRTRLTVCCSLFERFCAGSDESANASYAVSLTAGRLAQLLDRLRLHRGQKEIAGLSVHHTQALKPERHEELKKELGRGMRRASFLPLP